MVHSPARSTLEVGSVIAETYVLEQLIGRGGMGAVFLASHVRLPGKRVAIKILHADVTDEEVLARFRHEATITSQLNHPNIVEVHDFDVTPDGIPYMVLEYLEGETLYQRLREGPIALDHALSIMREVGSALAAAHRIGVVHRDLKPQNIFLVRTEIDGRTVEVAKVLDFGISKMRSSQTVQTQDNALLGTPQYMSPEQAIGQHTKVDARTDVFALGSILYEMLCGHPAFSGASIPEVVFKVVYEQPLPISDEAPTLPRKVTSAIEQAMSKTADDRFATVGGFVEALTGEALARPRPSGAAAVVDGPTSAARKASLAHGPTSSVRTPMSAAEQLGATQGPGAAARTREQAAVDPPRPVAGAAIGTHPTLVGVADSATVSSISRPTPVRKARTAPSEPASAAADPPTPAPRSRAPIVLALGAAAAGAIVVYAVMRPPAPAPAAVARLDAAVAVSVAVVAPPPDAAAAVPVAVAVTPPVDAAVAADASAPKRPLSPQPPPVPANHPPAAGIDDSADSPQLAQAESELSGGRNREALRLANGVINNPSSSDAQRAAAHGVHGVAACRAREDVTAHVDLNELAQLGGRWSAAAHTRVLDACHKLELLPEQH